MTSQSSASPQKYTFNYEAREKAFIDYARSKGYKETADFDTYNFESNAIRALKFNIWEHCEGRESTPDDIARKVKITRHYSSDGLPDAIEKPLASLEGRVIELGEFALKMFDFKNHEMYFRVHCFSSQSHEITCEYALRKTGHRGDVFVICEEEQA